MHYFIKLTTNKPKNDINQIVESMGYLPTTSLLNAQSAMSRFFVKIWAVFSVLLRVGRGDVLLIQYPLKKFYTVSCILAHVRGGKVVTLVHDLGTFRRHKLSAAHEIRRLSHSDVIVVHNPSMQRWLVQHDCKVPLCCLGIFDYLSSANPAASTGPHTPWRVVFGGGLGKWRSGFLYNLDNYVHAWELQIYGKGFQEEFALRWTKIHYCGQLPPDDFVAHVEADFGLVWDGDSMDECIGNWGTYLLVNNPHKTSFYLRAGLPVIIWNRAAMAPFVLQNKVGLTVGSLKDIDKVLTALSPADYEVLRRNARALGQRLAEGYYTKQALQACDGLIR
jgi:hypothetical protein